MALPYRIRGVAGGLLTLIAGPAVAAALLPGPLLAATVAAHAPAPVAAVRPVKMVIPDLQVPGRITPLPTPTPAPRRRPVYGTPVAHGPVADIIMAAAQRHGVDGNWMIRIAKCESGLNPTSYNPSGPYVGLFQFLPSTFRAHGGTNIYDPYQQADIAATMLSHGGAHAWPVCSLR